MEHILGAAHRLSFGRDDVTSRAFGSLCVNIHRQGCVVSANNSLIELLTVRYLKLRKSLAEQSEIFAKAGLVQVCNCGRALILAWAVTFHFQTYEECWVGKSAVQMQYMLPPRILPICHVQ